MAEIRINYPKVSEANKILRSALLELEMMEGALAAMQQALPAEIQTRREIGEKLNHCRRSAETTWEQARQLLRTVEEGSEHYQDLDRRVARMVPNCSSINMKR